MEQRTALELRRALRRGETSSRELVARALELVSEHRDSGAFVSADAEIALAEADAVDARLSDTPPEARRALPPLLGLPTAHKDLIDQRGHVTTHGSAAIPHLVAAADDPVAAAVREAGAVSIGKTQVPEFGIAAYSENEIAPPARNPFDPALTAGGSSGGTAAAVALGLIPAAIASDAGGSIRIPAAACGLVGLKPGRGAVPADRRAAESGPGWGVSGPIARTPADAALLFDALRGARDEAALRGVERASELRGLRVGISLASPFEERVEIRFGADALAALDAAAAALDTAGHTVEEARIRYDAGYPEAFTAVWTSALTRIALAPGAEDRLGALASWFLDRARITAPERLEEAAEALRGFAAKARRDWGAYDAVLTPALAFPPPPIGEFRGRGPEGDYRLQCEWAPQTSMVNVAGAPAITVPLGRAPASAGASGLPVGVQLIGPAGGEARLLQLAEQIVQLTR
ncbi:amidase [Leucobacter weissii]|uniref:amidase n=1 Tax=Leucobacter weissii TaxID=1983706 RepID=UPI0031330AE3